MIKVAMIGAGSVVFSKNLTGDILSFPEFRDATFSYMDVDPQRLEVGAGLCRKVAKALGASPTIHATTDRREALAGADFVINMVQIGGLDSTLVDFEIPRKHGLNFTIADTTGPGGLFRALRTFPVLRDLCRDMEEVCPRAILLNYSNPMSMNMQTVSRTHPHVRAVGLCHSVQGTLCQLAGYLGARLDDLWEGHLEQLRQVLRDVWEHYYHLGEPEDLPFALAALWYRLGDYAQAAALFERSLAWYGDDARTRWNLSLCHRARGDEPAAAAQAAAAVRLDPVFRPPPGNLASKSAGR